MLGETPPCENVFNTLNIEINMLPSILFYKICKKYAGRPLFSFFQKRMSFSVRSQILQINTSPDKDDSVRSQILQKIKLARQRRKI